MDDEESKPMEGVVEDSNAEGQVVAAKGSEETAPAAPSTSDD